MLEAAGGGGADEGPVLRDDLVLPGQAVHAAGAPRAAAVERQRVGGDVIGPPVEHALDVGRPRVDRESRQAVHEVHAHVVAAGLAGGLERRAGAARVVQASERLEHGVVERLHAEAHAGDAGRAITREPPARHALRIALDGDLGVGGQPPALAQVLEHGGQRLGLEQRGRAAAEEDGGQAHVARPVEGAEQVELAVQGAQVGIHLPRLQRRRVEGAVVAALHAERNVQVEAERASGRSRVGGPYGM